MRCQRRIQSSLNGARTLRAVLIRRIQCRDAEVQIDLNAIETRRAKIHLIRTIAICVVVGVHRLDQNRQFVSRCVFNPYADQPLMRPVDVFVDGARIYVLRKYRIHNWDSLVLEVTALLLSHTGDANRQIISNRYCQGGVCLIGIEPEFVTDADVASQGLSGVYAGDGYDTGRAVFSEVQRLRALEHFYTIYVQQSQRRDPPLGHVNAVNVVRYLRLNSWIGICSR